MIGAIAGDIIGSVYERHNITILDFPLFDTWSHFTDDTILTCAVADAILTGVDYGSKIREWFRLYPERGYGSGFRRWAAAKTIRPRYSIGNGSAMRVSPIGFAFDTLDKVLDEARKSAIPSHNHPESIKGAQAVAGAISLARTGHTKQFIKEYIANTFSYNLDRAIDQIRPTYRHDYTCKGSVPEAIIAFLESTNYENAIRLAVSLGGDSDTIACIAGGIAEAYYGGIPNEVSERTIAALDRRLQGIVMRFSEKYRLKEAFNVK